MKVLRTLALLAACVVSSPAAAQAHWYAGIGFGQSRTDDEVARNRESPVVNGTITGSELDDKASGYKIFGGYRFLPWLAVEASYADLGRSRTTTHILGPESPPATHSVVHDRDVTGMGVDVVLSAPLTAQGSIFGRVGVVRSRLEAETSLASISESVTVNETVTRYGFGGDWMFTRNLGLRVEWERWLDVGKGLELVGGRTGEADVDFYSINFIYRF